MWELATQPALLDMLRRHVGPDVVLFSTQLAFKPPACDGGGEAVPWHVDGDGRCRTVWLPLDDVDEGSGGLMVLPGRHAAGRAPFRRLRTASDVATFRFYHKYSLYEVDVSQAQRRPWAVRKSRRRRRAGGLIRRHRRQSRTRCPRAVCRCTTRCCRTARGRTGRAGRGG